MSTRSNIGYLDPKTNMYHYIYAHWDGYMSHHGRILRDHYKTLHKVKMLVNLGSISILNKNVRPPKNPRRLLFCGKCSAPIAKHTFDEYDRNTVLAYHRDRNDSWDDCKPTISKHFPIEQAWAYCFINGKWHYKTHNMSEWVQIPDGDLEMAQKQLYESFGY
jgi:hypothetical protein